MWLEESKFQELVEYAQLIRGRMNRAEIAVELGILIYSDPEEYGELPMWQIKDTVRDIMENL